MAMKRPGLSWILALLATVSSSFIVVKEIVDPSQIRDLKIDKVRYEDLPALTSALELFVVVLQVMSKGFPRSSVHNRGR